MVDPYNVTNYNRSNEQLEEFILFCVVVAGKTANIQTKKLDEFLKRDKLNLSPFQVIEYYLKHNVLESKIIESKLGQYNRLIKSFSKIINFNLKTCSAEELETIPGIGPKTARFFLLHSRPNQNIAVLDTHILKWLGSELKINVPKSTPTGKKYLALEKHYLDYCVRNQKNPAKLDLEIWTKYNLKTSSI